MAGADFQVDLRGRAAIVTGAGAGCGRRIALALAGAGASVALNDRNPDRAEALRAEIGAEARTLAWPGDVSNRFQAAALIEGARGRFGRVSLLVNAAGAGPLARSLLRLDEWDWRRLLDVNLTGAFFCTQLLGRVMAEEGGGAILNLVPGGSRQDAAGDVATLAARAGLLALTRQSARELGPAGIRVNALCAGEAAAGVGEAALWLCSDAAQAVSGQCLQLDAFTGQGLIPR